MVRSGDTRGCPEVSPGGDVFFFDKELAVPPPAPLPTIVDAGNDDFLDKKVLVEPRRAAVDSDEDTDDEEEAARSSLPRSHQTAPAETQVTRGAISTHYQTIIPVLITPLPIFKKTNRFH